MAHHRHKRGSTAPLTVILQDADGPVNLTGRTVVLVLRLPGAAAAALSVEAVPAVDQVGSKGYVSAYLAGEDGALLATDYRAEWADTTGGEFLTYPYDRFDVVTVSEPLAAPG